MQTYNVDGQESIFAPDFCAGRMSPVPSHRENRRERTSGLSWKKSVELKTIPYQYLDLSSGTGNLLGELQWEMISPWHGEYWTLNTGPAPLNAEDVYTLSQILQEEVPTKYFLSKAACLGILRRADERGKALPLQLERALKIQSGLVEPQNETMQFAAYHINQRDEGIELHGVSGALMATNNMQMQTFCITGNIINRQPQNGGNGFGYQEELAYTLTAMDKHAVFSRQRVDQFREDTIASTESARQGRDAIDLIMKNTEDPRLLIRRLTPLECERLQGFPDGWTNIPNAPDGARYKALGNSVAIPCVNYVMRGIALSLSA